MTMTPSTSLCLLLLYFTNTAAYDGSSPFLRRLGKPACNDGTCRKACSDCPTDSQECTTCLGGGGGGGDPTDPPSTCSVAGETCKGGALCCLGFACVSKPKGVKVCEAESTPAPAPPISSPPSGFTPPAYQDYYSGGTCTRNGPEPTASNTILEFWAFGDAPYDEEAAAPFFQGEEYDCLQNSVIPGMLNEGGIDFVAHIGDIKKGKADGGDPYCTTELFTSRKNLFDNLEQGGLDFFLVVGDNEWNECAGYDENNNDDPIKTLWRNHFALPQSSFSSFDQATLPSGAASPIVERDILYPENFFFFYNNVAFFGVTEPAAESTYNSRNRDWVQTKLSGLNPAAIVIFGHANLSTITKEILPTDTPILYVHGNGHPQQWCMQFDTTISDFYLDMEVEAFLANPLKVSIVEQDGQYFFHVAEVEIGCIA